MSDFTGESVFESFPSLYEHNKAIGAVSELSDEVLDARRVEYQLFLSQPNLMPRAKETAQRVLCRLAFESMYRQGFFTKEETNE